MLTELSIENELKSLISEIAEVELNKVNCDASLTKDLGVDSMRALELLAALEKKYKIEIAEEDLPKLDKLGTVVELVKKYLAEKS
ncbi:MAG: acyl carrier protein [Candidatus Omnitrophota bacterium]